MMRRKLEVFLTLLMVMVSLLLGFVCSELGYRIYLAHTIKNEVASPTNWFVMSDAFWDYDRDFGFTYTRNGSMNETFIRDGLPALCVEFIADSRGNPGHNSSVANPKKRIYVFGDSFTMYQHGHGSSWPALLEERLNVNNSSIEVRNYARDGTGVLQMFDSAVAAARAQRPDLVIIAFIAHDLIRARVWREAQRNSDGTIDMFTSIDPDLGHADGSYARSGFVDTRASRQWCESARRSADANDPVLARIRATYSKMLTEDALRFGKHVDFTTLRHSYLLSKLVHKDPFYQALPKMMPSFIGINSFADDPAFMRDVETLKRLDIPLLFVWLPQIDEMKTGHHILTDQQQSLYESLVRITGRPVIDVLPTRPLKDDADPYYMVPVDQHPSEKGLGLFADGVYAKLNHYWPVY